MTPPSSFASGATNRYTPPSGTVLTPNTRYWLRINSRSVPATQSNELDTGSTPGWRLEKQGRLGTTSFTPTNPKLRMRIEGLALLGVPSPPSDLSVTHEGTGEVTLSWAAPLANGQSGIWRYEVRHRETNGGSFGAWSRVADSDDEGTGLHDERSTVIDDLVAGTRYTFQVRAVNSQGNSSAAEVAADALTLYVSNEGVGSGSWSDERTSRFATSFSTGSQRGGYRLDSVALALSATGSQPTVSVWSDSSGSPGSSLKTLTRPSVFPSSIESDAPLDQVFTTSNFTLAADTTYWVVVDYDSESNLGVTASGDEAGEPAPGWSIATIGKYFDTSTSSWRPATGFNVPGISGIGPWIIARMAVRGGTDIDFEGSVSMEGWPQVGTPLTASLTDRNGSIENVAWQWRRAGTRSGQFTDIGAADGGTSSS